MKTENKDGKTLGIPYRETTITAGSIVYVCGPHGIAKAPSRRRDWHHRHDRGVLNSQPCPGTKPGVAVYSPKEVVR